MKKVILHIGHDKTATTSIQTTFRNNAELLFEFGYLYPLPDSLSHHNKLFVLAFKDNLEEEEELRLYLRLDGRWPEIAKRYKHWLAKELSETKADTIIFSGEYFPNFSKEELIKIRSFFESQLDDVVYEVHMYTRNPVSYSESSYQQRARRFPSDEKVICFLYQDKVSNYIEVFGKQSVHLHKFEEGCNHVNGPVYFLDQKLGIPERALERMHFHRENDSISELTLGLLLYINNRIPYTRLNVKEGLRRKSDVKNFLDLPGSTFRLDKQTRKEVIKTSRKDMDWLNETFGISYSFDVDDESDNPPLVYTEDFAEKLIVVLGGARPIIRKLTYEFLNEEVSKPGLDNQSKEYLEKVLKHIRNNYRLSITLSYGHLALPQSLSYRVITFLQKFSILIKLKRKLMGHSSAIKV